MSDSFELRLSADEFRAGVGALTHELAAVARTGQRMMYIQLGAALIASLLVTAIWPQSFVPLLVAIMLYGVGQSIAVRFGNKSMQSPTYDEGNAAELRVRFGPTGFTDSSAFRSRRWRWSSLRAIREAEQVTVLILSGWDMLILPHRLWSSDEARHAFVARVRDWSGQPEQSTRPVEAKTVDQIVPWPTIGGIAAGVMADLLVFPWLITAAAPLLIGEESGRRVAVVLGAILIGLIVGYLVYRLVKSGLERLSPQRRAWAAQGITYIFPAYMLAAWLGWF